MVTIPSILFTKYAEFADAMLSSSGFGVQCKLIYTDRIDTVATSIPSIKQKKSMNLQSLSPTNGFSRGDSDFKTVETTEDIVLRVYWTQKDFKKFGNIQVPDGSIMTIGNYADLIKVNRAKAIEIHSDQTGHVAWRFTKLGEPTIHGLDSNYFTCFWVRS